MQFCPVFDISSIGLVRLDGYAYYEPYTAPAASANAVAKANANSITPMSAGDGPAEQPKPIDINVPEGLAGLFSVDEDGNVINAMTGEAIVA